MRYSGAVDPKNIVVRWLAAVGCMTCVASLAWQGGALAAEALGQLSLAPALRSLVILGQLPCALYLRACNFEDFPMVPIGGIQAVVICDICIFLMALVGSVWIATEREMTVVMMAVYGCLLAVVISVIFTMYRMCRDQETVIELQAERQRLQSERVIADMVAVGIDELRCLRHEMKNQYAYISILLREQRYEELEQFCGQLESSMPPMVQLANSGNRVIDTVLNMELARAKQISVPVEYELALPETMPLAPEDVCAILANLMDNALEECQRLREKGREDGSIRLTIRPYGSYLYIVCRNSTDRQTLEWRQDALRTTKSDTQLHGYGTRIINKLAKKYNGTADYKLKDGAFVAKVMLDTMEERP